MYRQPQNVGPRGGRGRGRGGGFQPPDYPPFPPQSYGGAFQPPNYPPFPPQNPIYPFPANPHYHQNPNFPLAQNPYPQTPTFPQPNPSPSPQSTLERIESAAAKAQRDLVTAGHSISAWKVAQSALVALKVDSWSSLGLQLQDVPSLRRILVVEGKVNAFIHCFVGARRITSLYELEAAICKSEGVERFEELGLGPLTRHPLAEHYFSVPSDSTEVFRITSEDIIAFLRAFIEKRKKIAAGEFLDFLAQQKSVPVKETLGVRIQSLGLHVSCIREAKKAEETVLSKSLEVMKHSTSKSRGGEGRVPSQPRGVHLEKQVLDMRFDLISKRIKSFSSIVDDSSGKHTRFDSDGDDDADGEDEDGADDLNTSQYRSPCHDKESGQRVSSCPYPSTTEEMVRLGLKFVSGEKETPGIDKILESGGKKSSGKKRKSENKSSNSVCKLLRKEQAVELEEVQKKLCTLTNCNMEKFITTWKEACREHPVAEVLEMMVNFYVETPRAKKMIRKAFSSYPGIGLLNVAVSSIKCGMLDSLYDTVQAFGEHGFISSDYNASAEMIEIGPSVKDISVNNKCIDEFASSISVDDITKKLAKYFDCARLIPSEKDLFSGKQFLCLKKLYDCETWLEAQFSTKQFSSLGYGSFLDFLEKHASFLPNELHNFLSGKFCDQSCVEVSMLEQQLRVLLSQVKSSFMDDGTITKTDMSMLLKKQFPTLIFHIVGNEPEKCFVDLIKKQKDSYIDNSNCVLFSTTLLGKQWTGYSLVDNEKPSSEAVGKMSETSQEVSSLTVSSKDAIECLLKAPMLSDLLSWSHWDLIYASSLGPLLEWLLNEVRVKELLCIATVNGKLIRIDHSATVDEFLEALIQCSPFQAAVKLLSLLSLYRGTRNAPLSLFKCYVQRAFDVIINNSIDSVEVNTMRKNLLHKFEKDFCANSLSDEATNHGRILCESLSRINGAVTILSRFILECLGHLPPEFQSFAAEIFVSGLRSFTKDVPLVILHSCNQTNERLMLHDIGLSLGITEWIEDYHKFCSTVSTDLFMSSESRNKKAPSLCSESGIEWKDTSILDSVVDVASLMDGNHHTSDKVYRKKPDSSVVDGYCKSSDEDPKREAFEVTNDNSGMLEDRKLQDAIQFIETIRREEFGLDPNLNYSESCLLRKQHARLGRALHCLSQELYSQDSHLLLELVQNADDNIYPENVDPTLVFILQDTGIIVLNNEQGFSAQNIRALCDIGNSTKKGSSAGYIGHKGIGFKSVFRVTDAPEIHSNGFHVKFDITEGQIGFVLPTVVSPCDFGMFRQILYTDDDKSDCAPWNTCILLPFRSKFRHGTGMNSIISMFSDLHPSLLLFLHRLQCMKFKNMLNDKLVIMRRETLGNGIVRVSHGEECMNWLVVSQKLQASTIRRDVQTTEIAMAFTLQETDNGDYEPHLSQQPVFAFLPLRNYGLKFILQGDFVLPSSREEVDGDSAWNQWLLSEFPALFVTAEQSFSALPCFHKNPGKAVTAFMSFVPLLGEVHGFFSHLPHMIISKLRMSNCLLLDGPDLKWVLPCRVLRGWNEQARMLLSDNLLQKHLGLGYLSKDVVLSDSLAKALGIVDYGPKILIDIISSICHTANGISSLGLDWLSAWLVAVYSTLSIQSSGYSSPNAGLEYDIINSLRKIPFIPLSDGSFSSLTNGPIWLPCDALSIGFEGKHSPKDFPNLYAKLRTVNPLLLSVATPSIDNMQDTRVDTLIQMLCKIGVQQLSAHDVIKSHILVALSDDTNTKEDGSLMIEYLSFIMLHFQYACASCHSDKAYIISEICKIPVILTNHGYKCPVNEPIHFGKEYKNPVDIDRLIDKVNVKWLEVDVAYLKHPSIQSLSSGLVKWREFFLELGVTDFVQVTFVDKKVPDILNTASGSMIDCKDLILPVSFISDWESPELINLLFTFSSKKFRSHCIYLLEILDKMWDDYYSAKSRIFITSSTNEDRKAVESSFLKSIRESQWVVSNLDEELHHSKDLFYDCEEVRSILGTLAPYAVPKVTSKLLLKDIGFKTQVSLDDALYILHSWGLSKVPLMASVAQMSKLYTFISDGVAKSKVKITEEFIASSFIFVPFCGSSRYHEVVSGMFLSPKEAYWHDPTGCVDKTQEMILLCTSPKKTSCSPCKALSSVYPSLYDFFVNTSGVHCLPPFESYIQILLQLSTVALPSQAAHVIFQVFLKWADDLKSGSLKSVEVSDLKEKLVKLENTVLPTLQDKWVSLHPSFGIICWSDDDELKQQFKHSDGVDFLQFGELSNEEKEMLSTKVAILFKSIGIPVLSEIVSREAIFYGTDDNREKTSLINWVLPYAQRYLHRLYPDAYLTLKQLGFEKLSQLKVVVVENLFYKYTLKGHESSSKKRSECSCILQGNILYATHVSDSHSMFLELSRLFFNGSMDLHLANFLHMVTTMAESGATSEQTEFFIVNSQKVPELPNEETVWSLSSFSEVHVDNCSQPFVDSAMNNVQKTLTSKRKPSSSSNWPPRNWKTAPDFDYCRKNYLQTKTRLVPPEAASDLDDLPVPIEINGDWIIEERLTSTNPSVLQDSATLNDQAHEVESFDSVDWQIIPGSEPKSRLSCSIVVPETGLPTSPERERLCLQTTDENQSRKTGRLGEMVAYKYFAEKLGLSSVKWVNEEMETGLPYDLVIGEKDSREYVEVKSTKSSSKDWFEISMRECLFAAERGDSFSIAHVVLLGQQKATITVLRNPQKLCQQNALRLAFLMSRQLRDSSASLTT